MTLRLALLAAAALASAGCCCLQRPGVLDTAPVDAGRAGCRAGGACLGLLGRVCRRFTCESGCGEVYWGEWISDPPDCSDPCDHCGRWTGDRARRVGWLVSGVRSLWGARGSVPPSGQCAACEAAELGETAGPWAPVPLDAPSADASAPLEEPSGEDPPKPEVDPTARLTPSARAAR